MTLVNHCLQMGAPSLGQFDYVFLCRGFLGGHSEIPLRLLRLSANSDSRGTLAGKGTISHTQVKDGGILPPGTGEMPEVLDIARNLALQPRVRTRQLRRAEVQNFRGQWQARG
jgi:hypothetical protein